MKIESNKIVRFLLLGILFSLVLSRCAKSKGEVQRQTRYVMDTYCTIQIPGGDEVRPAIDKAFERIQMVEKKFDVLDKENALWAFNHDGTVVSDTEIVHLLSTALDVGRKTEGAFDLTIYPLMELWGFFTDHPALPKDEEIKSLMNHVGLKYLDLEGEQLQKNNPAAQIDLGGIAKGYAVHEAVMVLKREGITSALIDAGGDIYALGELNDRPWKIGIKNPKGEGTVGFLEISDLAVVTSGDYERYFEKDGVRYHHILDPKTGYPARGLTSVTVVADDPTLADALSTALFVMGKEKGLEFVNKSKIADAIFITDTDQIYYSDGLK